MGLWSKLFRFGHSNNDDTSPTEPVDTAPPQPGIAIELPIEPYVFECQACGKVFEMRRRHPHCPECDSEHVSLVSE